MKHRGHREPRTENRNYNHEHLIIKYSKKNM